MVRDVLYIGSSGAASLTAKLKRGYHYVRIERSGSHYYFVKFISIMVTA
jgi:hypothetical protein